MIEFLGGPLDGFISEDRTDLPSLIVHLNREALVYKRMCCGNCSSRRRMVPYSFAGYAQDSVAN